MKISTLKEIILIRAKRLPNASNFLLMHSDAPESKKAIELFEMQIKDLELLIRNLEDNLKLSEEKLLQEKKIIRRQPFPVPASPYPLFCFNNRTEGNETYKTSKINNQVYFW